MYGVPQLDALKRRIEAVEADLMIDNDDDGVPDVHQIAQNKEQANNAMEGVEKKMAGVSITMKDIGRDLKRMLKHFKEPESARAVQRSTDNMPL